MISELLVAILGALVAIAVLLLVVVSKKSRKESSSKEVSRIVSALVYGSGLGVAFGLLLVDNFAIGYLIGVAFGSILSLISAKRKETAELSKKKESL